MNDRDNVSRETERTREKANIRENVGMREKKTKKWEVNKISEKPREKILNNPSCYL